MPLFLRPAALCPPPRRQDGSPQIPPPAAATPVRARTAHPDRLDVSSRNRPLLPQLAGLASLQALPRQRPPRETSQQCAQAISLWAALGACGLGAYGAAMLVPVPQIAALMGAGSLLGGLGRISTAGMAR